jgi:hypothetical protein
LLPRHFERTTQALFGDDRGVNTQQILRLGSANVVRDSGYTFVRVRG